MGYALVIGYNPDQYSENNFTPKRWLAIDVQSSKKVSTRSTIASQPIQTGDTISDHMYRQAVTESISGSFGILHGDRTIGFVGDGTMGKQQYMFNGMSDRLQDVETEFEYIKNNGFLCELDTVDMDNVNSRLRFRQRKNMALQNITWTEHENTVDFDFEFYEVIFANSRQVLPIDKDKLSEYGLPDPNYTIGTSLAVELMDNTEGLVAFIAGMYKNGIITEKFLNNISKYRNDDISKEITEGKVMQIAGLIGMATGAGIAATAAIAASIGSVGTPLVGIVIGVAVYVGGVILSLLGTGKLLKASADSNAITEPIFDVISGTEEISEATLELWDKFIAKSRWLFLSFYDNCTVYKFSSNSTNQSMTINIGSSLWEISYTLSKGDPMFKATKLTNLDSSTIISNSNAFGQYSSQTYSTITNVPAVALSDLNFFKNGWFSDLREGYEVYLFNSQYDYTYNYLEKVDVKNITESDATEVLNAFQKEYKSDYNVFNWKWENSTSYLYYPNNRNNKTKFAYFYNLSGWQNMSSVFITFVNSYTFTRTYTKTKTNVLDDYRILVFKGDVQEEYDKMAHLIYDVISVGLSES